MEIEVWNGDWGLPTIDYSCLQMMSLLKFSGVQFETRRTNNPFRSINGHLPVFKHRSKTFTKFSDVHTYLIDQNHCPDADLDSKQLSESLAYRYMIEEDLYPALKYTWWMDTKNYNEVTRPWYSDALPFLQNFYYPSHYKKENEEMIRDLFQDCEENEFRLEIFRRAETCLTCLSRRLGDKDFFFGNYPTSLDAFVYGCLAPLIKAPFKSSTLQVHAKASANLYKFVTRITQRYLTRELLECEEKVQKKASTEKSPDFLPHRRRNQILAVAFALGASFIYGISMGILSISSSQEESDENYAIEQSDYSSE